MIGRFLNSCWNTTVFLCLLIFGVELWIAPSPVAIPAAIAFTHAWFFWIVILSGILAYINLEATIEKEHEETKRRLHEKQG